MYIYMYIYIYICIYIYVYIYMYIYIYDIFNLRNFRSLTEGSSLRQTKKIKHNREMISKVCPSMKLTAVFLIYSLKKIFEQTK